MHVQFGDYHVRDVKFVVALDVDAKKVGQDLSAAIFASENNTIKFSDVPPTGITVLRGHTYDGLGKYYRDMVVESDDEPVDVVKVLKDAKVDVLVCYLPVGSEDAAKFYAQCAIDAGVGFVNALPVFIAGTKGRRILTPNTSILSHQFSWSSEGKAHELFATMREFELTQSRMVAHYEVCTGLNAEEIRKHLLPPQDIWLSAEEALVLGLCDHVSPVTKK
jgi:hypothetical protein